MQELENRVACELKYTDIDGIETTFCQEAPMYREHELNQLAEYFKRFVNAIGYEWVEEVQIIKHETDDMPERIYSSY